MSRITIPVPELLALGGWLPLGARVLIPTTKFGSQHHAARVVWSIGEGAERCVKLAWEDADCIETGTPLEQYAVSGVVDLDDRACQGAMMVVLCGLYHDPDAHLARAEGGGWRVFLYEAPGLDFLDWNEPSRGDAILRALRDGATSGGAL